MATFDDFDADALDDIAQLLWAPAFDPGLLDADLAASLTSETNSPRATGERMQQYLRHLIDHPIPHMADRRPTWNALLPHCETLTPLQAYVVRQLMGTAANAGYEPMPDEVHLEFPRDDEVKLDAQCGWHFLVGSLWDADGGEYGVEIMFFGNAMYPPSIAESFGLSPIDNLAFEVQFAISERGQRHHQAEPLVALGTSGLIRTGTKPFGFAIGSNAMMSTDPGRFLPLRVTAQGVDRGAESEVGLGIDLLLTTGKAVLAQGEDGAMPAIGGIGTYYYSIPGIQIDPAATTIRIGDRTIDIVRGELWFDHQWGYIDGVPTSEVLRASNNIGAPEPSGWDWFMTHLAGDRQVTMFAQHQHEYSSFYGQTGEQPPGTMTRRVSGTFMDADASTRMVWGSLEVDAWVKTEHSPRPDRYPATHTWHPNHFRFTFDDLPDDIATFTMEPIVEGGQSAFFAHGAQICEGAVVVRNAAGEDIGRGFAESVSYADTTRNQLRLAGLPDTDELLALVRPSVPDADTAAANLAYVGDHQDELAQVVANAKGLGFLIEAAASASAGAAPTS